MIISVHQPRSDIYNMCDNVLLLAKVGGASSRLPPRLMLISRT